MTRPDTIVIGAGVMGSSIALRLAQAGQHVLVLERSVPGAEASSAAAGMLAPQAEADKDGPVVRLGLASRAAWPAFAEEVERLGGGDVGHARCGILFVARTVAERYALERRRAWQLDAGLDARLLTGEEALALEPALRGDVEAALLLPDEGRVDAQALATALPAAARAAGAETRRVTVRGIVRGERRVTGVALAEPDPVGGDEVLEVAPGGQVVIAAGAWASRIEGTGLPEGAIRPVRGQMVRLIAEPPPLERIVYTSGGYLVPRPGGVVLCGSTSEHVGFAKHVTVDGVQAILANARGAVPALGAARIDATWAGFRPEPSDGLPLIGPAPVAGLHLASGHHRNGILLTPRTAQLVTDTILGRLDGDDALVLSDFDPARLWT